MDGLVNDSDDGSDAAVMVGRGYGSDHGFGVTFAPTFEQTLIHSKHVLSVV